MQKFKKGFKCLGVEKVGALSPYKIIKYFVGY